MKFKPFLPAFICCLLWILVSVSVFVGNFFGIDETVGNVLRGIRSPHFDTLFLWFHMLFSARGMTVVCIILLLVPVSRTKIGIHASCSLLISALFNTLLKNIFDRPRPNMAHLVTEHSFSFPSGHSSAAAALSAAVIVSVFAHTKNIKARFFAILLCAAITIFVMSSRVYLGVHYPTDCIAGALSGFAVGYAVSFIVQKFSDNKKRKVL